ncbi:uncharacterized protein AB675_6462 [Cyphellophora attinorum]|uniref:Acriflavine sensitivity control protein acr-2 n=1 Tax=Cyphellophora attinorum TaxID=1664694 RepID=A0A0N0NQG9_9EURO|nr:uncharacterized protein AB675_6462 [Phialophora attinorum]KPI43689.1 hypothetical protein AB675_6462 [Phialophora attinorum]
MKVRFGGRPFAKSTFGKCLNGSAAVVAIESGDSPDSDAADQGFVYGLSSTQRTVAITSGPAEASGSRAERSVIRPYRDEIAQNPSHLQRLTTSQKLLLDHFLHTVTRSFSLHAKSHHGFCSTYLTLALHSSAQVLPTVLEASAHHRRSLGLEHSDHELLSLRQASLQNFQVPQDVSDDNTRDIAAATALMLCLCDVIAGGEKAGSWKLHLQGAMAILRQSPTGATNQTQMSTQRRFLYRWGESLEVLSLLGPAAALNDELVESNDDESDYIDEFHGFSRSLVQLIRQAHLLLLEQQSLREGLVQIGGQSHGAGLDRLSRIIQTRKEEHNFHPSLKSYIGSETQSDFVAVNVAFHHAVLLQLYRRVQGLAWDDSSVEQSTEAILTSLSQLQLREEACPGVAILQPLFDAGCSSTQNHHREQVLDLMDVLRKYYAMGNVSRAKAFLLEYWQMWDDTRARGGDLLWNDFLSQKGWELSLY